MFANLGVHNPSNGVVGQGLSGLSHHMGLNQNGQGLNHAAMMSQASQQIGQTQRLNQQPGMMTKPMSDVPSTPFLSADGAAAK